MALVINLNPLSRSFPNWSKHQLEPTLGDFRLAANMAEITLKEVLNELSSISHKKWSRIGTQIGVPDHSLKEFEAEADSLSEVINYWERGNVVNGPSFCWESVVVVLKTEHVGEPGLADKIKKKYWQDEYFRRILCLMTPSFLFKQFSITYHRVYKL